MEHLPPVAIPWWLRTRLWIHDVIETHLPAVSGSLLEGLLIGERRQLPPTLLADFPPRGCFPCPGHLRLQRRAGRGLGIPPPQARAPPCAPRGWAGARDAHRVCRSGGRPAVRAPGNHHGWPLPRRGPPGSREPRLEQSRCGPPGVTGPGPGRPGGARSPAVVRGDSGPSPSESVDPGTARTVVPRTDRQCPGCRVGRRTAGRDARDAHPLRPALTPRA